MSVFRRQKVEHGVLHARRLHKTRPLSVLVRCLCVKCVDIYVRVCGVCGNVTAQRHLCVQESGWSLVPTMKESRARPFLIFYLPFLNTQSTGQRARSRTFAPSHPSTYPPLRPDQRRWHGRRRCLCAGSTVAYRGADDPMANVVCAASLIAFVLLCLRILLAS